MSQQDLELVLDAYARFNAGEKRPDLWFWHEDAEYHASREDPDSAVHRGIDASRAQFASWLDAYPDLRVEPIESKENADTVFLWVRFSGHGGESGVPMEMELAHAISMRDGRPPAWSSTSTGPRRSKPQVSPNSAPRQPDILRA